MSSPARVWHDAEQRPSIACWQCGIVRFMPEHVSRTIQCRACGVPIADPRWQMRRWVQADPSVSIGEHTSVGIGGAGTEGGR